MSGVELRAGFSNDLIRLHLARLAIADAKGYVTAREDIGEYMVGEVQDNIDGQKLFDGSPMPQSKAAIKRRGRTLQDGGDLWKSYVHQLAPGAVVIGSNKKYAAIHHFGGETGRPGHRFTMTARPVLGVGPEQERHIGDLLIAEIEAMQ